MDKHPGSIAGKGVEQVINSLAPVVLHKNCGEASASRRDGASRQGCTGNGSARPVPVRGYASASPTARRPMPADSRPIAIALMGPTATGKTALALEWAERFGGEIVSVD